MISKSGSAMATRTLQPRCQFLIGIIGRCHGRPSQTSAGKLAARILARDNAAPKRESFTYSRFAEGRTFGSPNSHCPWV